ncbi:MAG TPA: hypothetical protein DD434_12550 [Bacteroidales bacterium]|nr:hypothetical protein [Bacteroidales bacterium]
MKSSISKFSVFAILLVAGLSIGSFYSCEEKEEPQQWECKLSNGVTITLDMYDSENKFYSKVSDTTSSLDLMFGNNILVVYEMIGDTMVIVKSGDMVITPNSSSPRWIINKPSDDIMQMSYYGVHVMYANLITDYEFHLK